MHTSCTTLAVAPRIRDKRHGSIMGRKRVHLFRRQNPASSLITTRLRHCWDSYSLLCPTRCLLCIGDEKVEARLNVYTIAAVVEPFQLLSALRGTSPNAAQTLFMAATISASFRRQWKIFSVGMTRPLVSSATACVPCILDHMYVCTHPTFQPCASCLLSVLSPPKLFPGTRISWTSSAPSRASPRNPTR